MSIRIGDDDPVTAATPVDAVTRFDHATLIWAKAWPEAYFLTDTRPMLIRPQTITSPKLATFTPGDEVVVRHYAYGGMAFYMTLNDTDISLEDIRIYGTPGLGFIVHAAERGFRFTCCRIERRNVPRRLISTAPDDLACSIAVALDG